MCMHAFKKEEVCKTDHYKNIQRILEVGLVLENKRCDIPRGSHTRKNSFISISVNKLVEVLHRSRVLQCKANSAVETEPCTEKD